VLYDFTCDLDKNYVWLVAILLSNFMRSCDIDMYVN
jgi:hypothetical protein